MEDNVLRTEQCRHLQELGLDMGDAKMYWVMCVDRDGEKKRPVLNMRIGILEDCLPEEDVIYTYTLHDILRKLPKDIRGYLLDPYDDWSGLQYIYLGDQDQLDEDNFCLYRAEGEDLLDSAYKMLCWVVENGYLDEK